MQILLSLIAVLSLSSAVLAQDTFNNLTEQVNWYQDCYEVLNPNQRGEQEEVIAQIVLDDSAKATNVLYRSLHQTTEYFGQDLMGRRTRMFRYILNNQSWDTPTLQSLANELFVAGYSWEAVTILNYIIDGRLPGDYR